MKINIWPVVQSLVSTNCCLRGIRTYRFPWYLTPVSANQVSSNRLMVSRSAIKTWPGFETVFNQQLAHTQ